MKALTHIAIGLSSLLILWLDSYSPVGLTAWLLYYILLVVVAYVMHPVFIIIYAAIFTFLTAIGFFIALPREVPILFTLENRGTAVIVLWALAYFMHRNRILLSKMQGKTDELSRTNRDLEGYVYSVSHDLKNPLTAMNGLSRMLEENVHEKLNKDERDVLSRIVAQGEHMQRLIADLLRLSRVGSQTIELKDLDLSQIARESFDALQLSLKTTGNIEISIQPQMYAKADAGLMRILFDNLIGNAIKFSSKSQSSRIEIGKIREKEEKRDIFFVKDNGVGFDMRNAGRLFAPFTRMHSPKDFEGTGIGLSIVRKIVERHGGRIWASSEVGKGTTLFFTLEKSTQKEFIKQG